MPSERAKGPLILQPRLNMLIKDSAGSGGHLRGWEEALVECPELLMKLGQVPPTLKSSINFRGRNANSLKILTSRRMDV